jgi:transcriptional regulator with XRE-family HTH domain
MQPLLSPVVANWELVLRLRQRRERLGIRSTDITRELGVARGYWSAIENERKVVPENLLTTVFDVLEMSDRERERMLFLRNLAEERGWWDDYPALFDSDIQRLFGLEQNAETIHAFDTLLIPGLLQTEEYIRAVCSSHSSMQPVEVGARVEARLRRQAVLQADDPPCLNVILSEAALRQGVAGPDVRRRQLDHLLTMSERPPAQVDIRVIPFSSEPCILFGSGSVCLLDFDNTWLPTVAWDETVSSWGVIADPAKVRDIVGAFAEATKQALTRQETTRLIEHYRDQLAARAKRRSTLDEMTRTAAEDGADDTIDEFIETR